MGGTSLASSLPHVYRARVAGVPIDGHALWAEVGGGIIFVTFGEFTGLHKSAPSIFLGMEVIARERCRIC